MESIDDKIRALPRRQYFRWPMYQYCYGDIIVDPDMSLIHEETSENNLSFSMQICRGYNNAANTSWISAARTQFCRTRLKAHPKREYRGLGKGITEETIPGGLNIKTAKETLETISPPSLISRPTIMSQHYWYIGRLSSALISASLLIHR